jgi:sugar phosphate isomerase/epimerase
MADPSLTLSVLTDEVSPRLEEGIAFALQEGLTTVDVRSIGGINFLSLDREAQSRAARQIRDAGLHVACLATPLLKWPPPGRSAASMGDQFGFDRQGRGNEQLYRDAFAAAQILGTRNIRVFTLLTYDGFAVADLRPDLDLLLRLAEQHDAFVHVENEPVCNVLSVPGLVELMTAHHHPRLRALLDIGNAWSAQHPPTHADLVAVMPFVTLMHFKDHDPDARRTRPVGEGCIPFAELLRVCFDATNAAALTLTVETHVPSDPAGATRRSLAGLRAALSEAAGRT